MASRRMAATLAYPRREVTTRNTTRVDHRSLILVIGLLTLAACAGVLYLSQASMAAELHFRLDQAQQARQALGEQNLAVRQQIADRGRLSAVEERAARLGMIDAPASGSFLACAASPAQPEATSPLTAAASPGSREADGGFLHNLLRRLGFARAPQPEQLIVLNAGHR